uniref:(California timema) hypothetical protein n=1 Tax=Timema californicum TaxID=61474 RepID=A0A7R9JIK8_TIMCA|nr:unnamed protein product [Timema californicum]
MHQESSPNSPCLEDKVIAMHQESPLSPLCPYPSRERCPSIVTDTAALPSLPCCFWSEATRRSSDVTWTRSTSVRVWEAAVCPRGSGYTHTHTHTCAPVTPNIHLTNGLKIIIIINKRWFNGRMVWTSDDGETGVRIPVGSPTASLVLTDSSQLTSDSQHLVSVGRLWATLPITSPCPWGLIRQ